MWKDSVEVFIKPRMPEKWDWSKLTDSSSRQSNETISTFHNDSIHVVPQTPPSDGTLVGQRISFEPVKVQGHGDNMTGVAGRGYLVTVMSSDRQSGRPVAVRSYVDKKRFLRSIQRLAIYPVIPVLSLLGLVAMNMTEEPSKGLYIYGTVMSTTGGLLNLFVFMLNPALPDIWKEAALESV
ncbi:hypothetical protein FB645_001954 [Coemansia sp. IMI 203386]|nr:hypothetical protein FB645_001954 [Coemansia sp. IMI 203386]